MNFLTPAPQTDVTGEEVMRDWFYQIGLFTVPQFLKPEFCAQLRAEVRQSLSKLAQVGRTDEVQVRPLRLQSWETIEDSLLGLKPELEQYFKIDLSELERPNVLRYFSGECFRWHIDASDHYPAVKDRKVSTLVYLNGSDDESGSERFTGGELEIYTHDLSPQEDYRTHCLQLAPKTGLLVAFDSRIRHQVQPVVTGTRYVISNFWR